MRLRSIDYIQREGELSEWRLKGLTLGPVNLLVGKNASGKTRALNIMNGLARLLAGRTKPVFRSGNYDAEFDDDRTTVKYILEYCDSKIVREELSRDGKKLLERGEGGAGKVFAEKEGRHVDFQTPDNELAAVARRDSIQHSFFEPLNTWGSFLYHYAFGSDMGKRHFAVMTEKETAEFNPRGKNRVAAIFGKGQKQFGGAFQQTIMADMGAIGYPLDDLSLASPSSLMFQGPMAGQVVGLCAKESDLNGITDQNTMSQGMFRALSIIIQVNYSEMASTPSCILIDDIGEGLDFERSCALIDLLMDKAKKSAVQLVMSTNDRFVMNKVPLETWSVLQREPGECTIRNYANSKAIFDEFKFTGMNNFDFFAVDYLNEEHQLNE